jgi:hypothetical protein
MDLTRQAEVVHALIPEADVRTDQCDILRVYLHSEKLMGAIRQLSDGTITWSVTDLASESEIPCITAPAELGGETSDEMEAANRLARELKRAAQERRKGRGNGGTPLCFSE